METTKQITRISKNHFGNIIYKDEQCNIYIGINCKDSNNPDLHYSSNNQIDGEPDRRVDFDFNIINPFTLSELKQTNFTFEYMMLSRLQDEVIAYIGKTGDVNEDKWDCRYRNKRALYGGTIKDHISYMKELYSKIPNDIKPEWLSMNDILEYENKKID